MNFQIEDFEDLEPVLFYYYNFYYLSYSNLLDL